MPRSPSLALVLLASCTLFGCDTAPATSCVVDAGAVDDAATPADDASDGTCGSITAPGFSALPEACLPRCSTGAREAFESCADLPCFFADPRVTGDDTLHGFVRFPTATAEVSCARSSTTTSCVDWQASACAYDVCPGPFGRAIECTASCDDERAALNTCVAASATYESCFQLRAGRCFSYF